MLYRIYRIVCDLSNEKYIGSTSVTLRKRLQGHLHEQRYGSHYKIHQYMREIGAQHFRIELIEEIEGTRTAARVLEEYHMRAEGTLNTIRAYVTREEEMAYKRAYYRIPVNRERMRKCNREYYKDPVNRERMRQSYRKYYNDPVHGERIRMQNRVNSQIVRDRKYVCCGKKISLCNRMRHEKTARHQDLYLPEKNVYSDYHDQTNRIGYGDLQPQESA